MKRQPFIQSCPALILFFCIFVLAPHAGAQTPNGIETPEKHFGFKPGTDRMLFDYDGLISYLQKLDAASPRLKIVEIGESPMGKKMYIAFISSEENINNLDNLKNINRRLALDPNIPETERESLLKDGRVFSIATLSMHSDEVGPSQSAPLIAHDFVTTSDPQKKEWLDNVVFMMVPSLNPDGMDMVINHYKKYKGTKYEGSSMPGVYHKYIGHDNNRDFLSLTQEDNKAVARIFSKTWFPQVMVSKHQMWFESIRYFVPPVHDPISENIDAGIWNWTKIFGSNMIKDMTEEELAGVAQHTLFDDYAPIYSSVGMWKNVICFLTEAASVKDATPIFIEANELQAYGKGLSEYKKSINMPLPWPGGWWKLSDIIDYEISSMMSVIKTSSLHRRDILEFINDLVRREVTNGKTKPPYYYVLPLQQHDESALVNLVNLLREHGVNVFHLTQPYILDDKTYSQGDIVIPLAQPFRPFIKEAMEKQKYPLRHYTPSGEIIKPYDVTSWSLPLHRGVKADEIMSARSETFEASLEEIEGLYTLRKDPSEEFQAAIFSVNNNESFKAAFLAIKLGLKVSRLTEAIHLESAKAPNGSFMIHKEAGKSEKMEQLINEMIISPIFVQDLQGIEATSLVTPRIALVETFFHDMDAGWSRYIFDTYYIPYKVIRPGDFEKTNFVKDFDVVVFPDASKSVLMTGKEKYGEQTYISSYPPEFTKGIGKEGMANLMTYLESGGIIISWNQSTELFIDTLEIKLEKDKKEEFQLPVRDVSKELQKAGLYCPGSLLRIKLLKDHPITLGMQNEVGIFFEGKPVFSTSVPMFDMDRRVIGKFPEDDILLSGYCEKEEKLSNKTCLAWLKKGKGQLVLFGFNPQYRAIINVSLKLLFNSLLLPKNNR